jgi:type I restriction enzyme S subunit
VKGVNIGDLRLLPVPLPPLEEQARIADELERRTSNLDDLGTELTASLRRSAALRTELLEAIFDGRIVARQ